MENITTLFVSIKSFQFHAKLTQRHDRGAHIPSWCQLLLTKKVFKLILCSVNLSNYQNWLADVMDITLTLCDRRDVGQLKTIEKIQQTSQV